jgi:hypothetical protein
MKPATRSPGPTPSAFSAAARRATPSKSSSWETRRFTWSSPQNTMASPGPRWRSRFSAKLSCASGKKRAPGIFSPSTSTGVSFKSPMTPQNRQTDDQNRSSSLTDQRCSAS